ncbi:C13 family peptidase [Actimicrobium sp. CCC2.4]|uniref:C13 family peptidase n=1 Tax=Actimicrobium sp. CCC2.4 TaxID=3048606 RepID=UPI002AC969F3|nr:C13 family peptidase [Actimicrobium sp. CCC2.4]MEB0135959.1 C13 family peptidase [Actimicrobium sp. CCC2.4]WPX32623.1 C13 family peptidase [Actimicrobium sp. CCC2.4]
MSTTAAAVAQSDAEQTLIERQVEAALYLQRPLLDQALATLAPTDPQRIGMYFLGVAGDGTQEVFRREVEFVRKQFDRDFGTRGRSIMLINSRNTVSTLPMATRTSLRAALQSIAGRMDRQKDILFLFLTSHGTPSHELVLGQFGMDLPGLQASELALLLKQQQIRWKVVVVSACYAGGFIAPLKDDRTLIITAARQDRSSFGCADDNDFTYFGRAFFKESLPKSDSFDEAFRLSDKLITSWELRDRQTAPKGEIIPHSYPQISSPAAIMAYLARWRAQLPPR